MSTARQDSTAKLMPKGSELSIQATRGCTGHKRWADGAVTSPPLLTTCLPFTYSCAVSYLKEKAAAVDERAGAAEDEVVPAVGVRGEACVALGEHELVERAEVEGVK